MALAGELPKEPHSLSCGPESVPVSPDLGKVQPETGKASREARQEFTGRPGRQLAVELDGLARGGDGFIAPPQGQQARAEVEGQASDLGACFLRRTILGSVKMSYSLRLLDENSETMAP